MKLFRPVNYLQRSLSTWNSYHHKTGDPKPNISGPLTLINMRFCPYAQRTVMALTAKKVEYNNINCALMEKPEWLWDLNPLGKVPVLIHNGNIIYESIITNDYIDEVFPGRKLNPDCPLKRTQERMLAELFQAKVVLPQMKIMFGFKRGEGSAKRLEHFQQSLKNLVSFEKRLAEIGTSFFHSDDHPGMMDYLLWPWFERIHAFNLVFQGEGLEFPEQRFPNIYKWMQRMAEEETVAPYLLDAETHAAFISSMQTGNPNYNLLLEQ